MFNVNWVLWVKDNVVYTQELLKLIRLVHQQKERRDDMTSLMIYCCDYVLRFLGVGGWYKVRGGRDGLEYRIDWIMVSGTEFVRNTLCLLPVSTCRAQRSASHLANGQY